MTFPTGTIIDTSNLDSAADDPSLAREDLYDLAVAVNAIIASANTANGVLVLSSGGKISATYIPTTINVSGDLNLTPTTGIVKVQSLLRLPPQFIADLDDDFANPELGDIVSTYDGDAGDPCLAMYDGTNWKVIALGATVSSS
jgi:hypothetical protein